MSAEDYSFNPFVFCEKLHKLDKPHYFYWAFQSLVGCSVFDNFFKGNDGNEFFANLKYFTKNPIRRWPINIEVFIGVLDYLLIVPFVTQLSSLAFFAMMDLGAKFRDYVDNTDILLRVLLVIPALFMGLVGATSLIVYTVGWVVTMPIKMILASVILLLSSPCLLWHYRHIQQQKLSIMQMPVLVVNKNSISMTPAQLSMVLNEDLVEMPFQDFLRKRYGKITVSALHVDSVSSPKLVIAVRGSCSAIIIPNKITKKGILAMLDRSMFNSSNLIDRRSLQPFLDAPLWKNTACTATGLFAVTVRIKACSEGIELKQIAAGETPDKLFSIISQFAGVSPPSHEITQANAKLISQYGGTFFRDPGFVDAPKAMATYSP